MLSLGRNPTALPAFRVEAVLCRETQILYDHSRQSLDIATLRDLYFYPRNPRAAFSCVKQSGEYQAFPLEWPQVRRRKCTKLSRNALLGRSLSGYGLFGQGTAPGIKNGRPPTFLRPRRYGRGWVGRMEQTATDMAGLDGGTITAIVSGEHGDPFAVLGMHRAPGAEGALVVRAFVPRASRVWVVDAHDGSVVGELPKLHVLVSSPVRSTIGENVFSTGCELPLAKWRSSLRIPINSRC